MSRFPLTKQDILSQYSGCFEGIGCFPGDPYKFHLKPDHQPARHASKKQGISEEVNEHTDWVHSNIFVEKASEREPYYTHSTGEITTEFLNRERVEHAGHFPTSMEMCMDDHLTQTTERTQQQHLQDKTSEQSCPTHSILPDFTFRHVEFPPGMESTPFFPGKQLLQGKEESTLPDMEKMSIFLGNQFLQGKEKLTGTFTLGTNILISLNFLNRHSALSTLTHPYFKPGTAPQNFQQLKMENSNMEAFPDFNTNAEATLQMDTSKKGPGAKDIPVTETLSQVTPMDHPEDDIQLPFRKANKISTRNPTHNSTRTLMIVQPQDSLSNQLDQLRKSKVQGNRLTGFNHYIYTDFQCDKKNLPTDLHQCWNYRETLSTPFVVSRTFIMMNTNMSTNHMINIQYLMSKHFSDSISNRSARPEENTAQKKYLTRLLDHNNIDLLCDKESSLTDLPKSWSHKELLHNIYRLINHGNQIIPVTNKEVYLLSRPLKAMAQWRIQYMPKEVHILSGPSELQLVTIVLPHNDYGIITQYTPREKDQDLPQLSSTSEAQHTHREPATAVSQALIASCKLQVDQSRNDHQCQNGHYSKPKVCRRTRSMLKIRSTDVRQTRHNYSQLTEIKKAKFQNPFTYNDERKFVKCNPVKKISDDLVYLTKDTSSASILSELEEREKITEDIPAPADVPAPAPADTLETVKGQPYTPGSRKSTRKNLGRPASTFSDFYM